MLHVAVKGEKQPLSGGVCGFDVSLLTFHLWRFAVFNDGVFNSQKLQFALY